jgi:hypothetical protein
MDHGTLLLTDDAIWKAVLAGGLRENPKYQPEPGEVKMHFTVLDGKKRFRVAMWTGEYEEDDLVDRLLGVLTAAVRRVDSEAVLR